MATPPKDWNLDPKLELESEFWKELTERLLIKSTQMSRNSFEPIGTVRTPPRVLPLPAASIYIPARVLPLPVIVDEKASPETINLYNSISGRLETTIVNFENVDLGKSLSEPSWKFGKKDKFEPNTWYPIDTIPKELKYSGEPIRVFYDHDSDPYFIEDFEGAPSRLTVYGGYCEGGEYIEGKGQCYAVWGGAYTEDESGEGLGPYTRHSNWWFEKDSNFKVAVAPTHWMSSPYSYQRPSLLKPKPKLKPKLKPEGLFQFEPSTWCGDSVFSILGIDFSRVEERIIECTRAVEGLCTRLMALGLPYQHKLEPESKAEQKVSANEYARNTHEEWISLQDKSSTD